jgi:hypothetical protein
MSDTSFYLKRRYAEVRDAMASNRNLEHGGDADKTFRVFLSDMAAHLGKHHSAGEEETYRYMLRCMAMLVKAHRSEIFENDGYKDPFETDPIPAQAPPEPEVPAWRWPVLEEPPVGHGETLDSADFRDFSALKMFGYTVGKTNPMPLSTRRSLLSDFMEHDLPPIVGKVFGDEYGDPMSTTRLRKIATHIANMASLAWRRSPQSMRFAISDWENDLQFLKTKYYEKHGLQFRPWPATNK